MKKFLLLLALGTFIPFIANAAPSGWVLGSPISSNDWIKAKGCTAILDSASCDYTGPSKALRLGYEYEFADEFWAGNKDRRLKNFCARFQEASSHGDYNQGSNPSFGRTSELANNGYRVNKNTSLVILKADNIYQINAVPQIRSSSNLSIKYVVEYANDEAATTRYQHTECYPYEISRCGDGVVDTDWFWRCDKNGNCDNPEECDYNDPNKTGWNDGSGKTCSKSCKLVDIVPACSSAYNNKTEYTSSSDQWLKSTDNLCDEGEVVDFGYSPETGGPRTYTWNCKNGSKKTNPSCTAKQERCGDGVVQEDKEDCDDGANNGKSGSSCSSTCTTVSDVKCGTKDKGKTYFDTKQTTPWLTKTSAGMCGNGLTVGIPILTGSDSHVEWTCSNVNGTSKTCKAYQEYCGDGVKNGSEACDGTDFCDSQCKKITPSESCDQTFTGALRLGDNKPFTDILESNWHDRYLFYKDVDFKENHGDYNNGSNPTFNWSSELVANGMKVDANKKMTIIESNPYHIVSKPTTRATDNIYIEYSIWYDNVPHSTTPSKNNLYSHKECVYYEISRCGDGTLDKDYGEECDPGSAGTSVLSGGKICNSECKIEDTPPQSKGVAKIEKTLQDKKEVSNTGEILTWDVRVWAEGGDVTDFQIKDIVPFALEYKSGSVTKNPDNIKVSDKPSGPVKVDTGNVYTWYATGTLKEGHELILTITTEVVLMPTSQDDYRNVACVIDDGKEDCDDDKPGTRNVEKTLISPKEISNVGDEITWSLKLTVNGGEVKNPVITDILPPVLGFSGYYSIKHKPLGVTISNPTTGTIVSGGQTLEYIEWMTQGTLKDNDYIEIELTTYVKEMPDEEYENVLCVKPENEDKKCDDEPVYKPELWIKKTFTDGKDRKTVKIGEEIGYRVNFGNSGNASATITSIKDFLPKNVRYITGSIHINRASDHSTGTGTAGEEVWNGFKLIEGVRIEIYGGMTLQPQDSGYIILTGEVLSDFTGNTQNWACIYLDDEKIDCDEATHEIESGGVSCKPTLNPSSFSSVDCSDTSAFTTTVTCSSTGGLADLEIICNGEVINSGHAEQLTGTCTGTANNTDYKVQCKVNGSFTGNAGEVCEGSFRRNCSTPSSCFVAGTKVTMADGTQKNIEDVKIGDKIMGENGINTVLGYDRPVLGERHLWSINGGEYFASDEHPFKTTEGWKSFNPEMTKLEIDLNTTELKVGDTLVTKIGLEIVETATYMDADYDTPLYNFVLDGDHTYYANGYLVHNKGGDDPYCKAPVLENGVFTCTSTDNVYAIGIDCDHVTGTENVDKEKISDKGREILSVSASCNQNGKVQCYVKKNSTSSWETKPSGCGWEPTNPGSSCFVAGTKVTMSDGSKKNIEDVKIGDKLLGSNGTINTVLGYDRPALGERHLWSINGGEYFVSDEHPFKTTEGWKSFNPEMTKLEIDLNTTKLNLGDKIITENGVEEIKTADYISKDANTQLYNFILDGDHTYHANGYLVHNKGGGSCFVAGTKVVMADGTEKNIEDVKVGEKIMGENGVNTVLGYDRPILRSRHLWSINGGEYFVSDEHPFKTTEGWKSFNPEMTKLEIDLNTTELKVGNILITKNGLEEIKTIDYIDEDYNTPLYNFVLDGDHTYYANGYLVHNKGNTPDPVLYDSAACFNVNTNNISIEQGEILPFFWNINNMENVKDWATELTGGFKSTVSAVKSDIVKANEGNKCSDDGFIALNSMICSFKITNGNHKTVYEGNFPCLRDAGLKGENWVSDQKLLDAWMTYGKNKYRGDGKYKFFWSFSNKDRSYALRSNLNYIENFGAGEDVFGEYKLSLTNIEYLQCRNDKWTLVSPKIDHCENNFVLTNPYTVQKTPSGNLRASTTTLDKYLYMDSNDVLQKAGGLLNAIATSEYAPNDTVNKAMSNFINKYQKLAISIKSSNGKTIKKVPGKDIYFVEGNINLGGSDSDVKFSKPVTFVQTKGIATINGSVEGLNMMLLTNGSITFNGLSNCKSRQVVKGIFYAKGGIYRTGVQKNTDLNNSQRCTEGGLTIKGVLIGGGLDGMMKKSRSNFNDWFETTDKKGIVMNGASVLIEYSPSVFTKSTMPPGAEDFTTALNVYKN